ncbi:MAG: hypothetical protein AMS24_00495 [Chlamydiae bacterium SM23_39]|nr:MAG: hypothetical protein AMS24_00495 [Chlamydiae bacterium SM23_39]
MVKFFYLLGIFFSIAAHGIMTDNIWISSNNDLSNTGQDGLMPQLAINGQTNTAICVWSNIDGINYNIQSSYSTDGGQNWFTLDVSAASSNDADQPQIAINEKTNTAICIWRCNNGSIRIIQSSYSTDGGQSWSTPIDISAEVSEEPQIAINEKTNRAICVWRKKSGSDYIIRSSYSTDGGQNWSTPTGISAVGKDADQAQITINEQTNTAICVWRLRDGSDYIVQSSYSTDGGQNWSTPTGISAVWQWLGMQQIAMNEQTNRAICVWAHYNGSDSIIQSSYSSDGGQNWSTPIDVSAASLDADQSQITINEQTNRAICVWYRYDGSYYIIQSAYSTDGGQNWSTPIDVSQIGADSKEPKIGIDPQTNMAICVWTRYDVGYNIVRSAYSTDGGQNWSTPMDVSDSAQFVCMAIPQIRINEEKSIPICVWNLYNGSDNIIQAAYFFIETGWMKVFLTEKSNDFWLQRELVKEIQWPSICFAKCYNIYKNIEKGQVLRIKQDGKLPLVTLPNSISNYILHRVKKGEVYYMTWENSEGEESRPVIIY